MVKHKPNIITISKVKPNNVKRELNVAEYMLEGYSIEPLNISKHKGRAWSCMYIMTWQILTCTILNLIFKKHNLDV